MTRYISKIIIGLVLIGLFISPALSMDFNANILPGDMEILSTDPSGDFDMYVGDAQSLSAFLNREGTTTWYIDNVESGTDSNSTTPDYYFAPLETGIINVTIVSIDIPESTQDNFTWFITVTTSSTASRSPGSGSSYTSPTPTPTPATEDESDIDLAIPLPSLPELPRGMGILLFMLIVLLILHAYRTSEPDNPKSHPPKR